MISAIGAVSANGMIGLDGWLPWDIPEELAYFERTVAGAALVIGRLTYESMDVVPEDSFIVSRRDDLSVRPGCRRVDSVEAGLRRLALLPSLLPNADRGLLYRRFALPRGGGLGCLGAGKRNRPGVARAQDRQRCQLSFSGVSTTRSLVAACCRLQFGRRLSRMP